MLNEEQKMILQKKIAAICDDEEQAIKDADRLQLELNKARSHLEGLRKFKERLNEGF
jgi:hypothetical protein